MKIEIHVEDLALHGLGPGQARILAEALRREVGRLYAAGGPPDAAARTISRLDAGEVHQPVERSAEAAGTAAGRAVAGVLGAGRGTPPR
jgi:hypothetical protein